MADYDVNAVPLLDPSSSTASNEQQAYDINVITQGDALSGLTYRMRANDTMLGYKVYWDSTIVDSAGTDYAGPGPLTDVVVSDKTP